MTTLVITNNNLYIVITFIVNMTDYKSLKNMKNYKSFKKERQKEKILSDIIGLLREKEISIAQLQRRTDLKRSTLIYYLGILEARGYIEKERIEKKETGRPTIIKLKKERLQELKRYEKKQRDYILEILKTLKKKGEITFEEYALLPGLDIPFNENPDWQIKSMANFSVLYSTPPLVERVVRLSKEGEKYLKNTSKVSNPSVNKGENKK